MGILKSLISVGGGIVGGLVGGPAGAKLGATLGGAVGGAVSGSKGSKDASKEALASEQRAREAYERAYGEVRGTQQPFLGAGATGVNALTNRLGLSSAGAPSTQNALTGSAGTYGSTANPVAPASYSGSTYATPSYQMPEAFSFDHNSFKENPFYQLSQEEGMGRVLASAGATGARQSGAALKALQDRGMETAYEFYAPERDFAFRTYTDQRDFGRGVYEDDRDFGRSTYEDERDFGYGQSRDQRRDYEVDRNYLTDRYDRGTDDMFRYTGIGQQAAGVVSNAAMGYGSNVAGSYRNDGETRASNALNQGDIWGGLAGDLGGSIASYFNRKQ